MSQCEVFDLGRSGSRSPRPKSTCPWTRAAARCHQPRAVKSFSCRLAVLCLENHEWNIPGRMKMTAPLMARCPPTGVWCTWCRGTSARRSTSPSAPSWSAGTPPARRAPKRERGTLRAPKERGDSLIPNYHCIILERYSCRSTTG
jgi:hypothetical protein